MTRRAAVAGYFYPADPDELRRTVAALVRRADPPRRAVALMAPHAGYVYSGGVAGMVYGAAALPHRFIALCPNHTGRGADLAINTEGTWETPLGEVPIDTSLARDLASRFPALREDPRAHEREHALEVQLPFLQHLAGEFRFVPICVGTQDRETLLRLGAAIADSVRACREPVLIVVSSDMSHYIPADEARRRDLRALAHIESVDAEGLHRTVHGEGISMCGIAPATAGVAAARALGAPRGTLVAYANSGDVTGDFKEVVGYAGMILEAPAAA